MTADCPLARSASGHYPDSVRGVIRSLLLAGGLSLLFAVPALAAPTWSAPVPLSGAGNAVALQPSIAINDGGLGIEAWAETVAGTSVIRAAQHVPGGAWTPFAGNVSTAFPGDACSPFAAIDPAGNALVVWSQWAGPGCGVGNQTMLFATHAAGAAAWSAPGVVGPAAPAGGWVSVAASSSTGQMIVAWTTSDATKKYTFAAIGSTTGGFGAPAKLVEVPTADNLFYVTAAIGPSGDAAVQWVHVSGMNANIEASVRRPGGAFPTTATPLTTLTSPSTSTLGALAINAEGDILSAFQKYDGTNISFVSEIYPMNGTAWILPQTITTVISPYIASWISVGIDKNGNSTAAWVESDFTTGSPYVRRLWSAIRPSGVASTWIGQTPLSDPTRSNDNTTTLAVTPSGAAAASWGIASPQNNVEAVYRPAGGSFGALTLVGAGSGTTSGSGASLSMAPSGDAAISFVGGGAPTDARVSVYDTTPPGIAPVAVPASATTGKAVAMSAGAVDAWSALASGQPSWNFGDGNLGAGGAVSHVYAAPGTYTVTIGASDALGNAATPVTRQIVVSNAGGPPPPPGKTSTTVKKPKLKAIWKAGHLVGTVSESGTVGANTTLTTSIRKHGSKKTRATSTFKVKKGTWSHTLKLPASLLPGRYDLFVSGHEVAGSKTSFTLAAPATGIVSRVYATGPRRGPAATTLGTTSELWAHFVFASLPKKGQTITTQWILPNGSKLAANTRPRTSLVEAQVKDLSGKPLPTGRWRCVLTAGGVVIATLNVRLR
jgi:hypothetical protein